MEEPRAVRESARSVAKLEPPSAISVEEPPVPVKAPDPKPQEQPRVAEVREFRNPHALPPNRITGPSFLGLSDESSETSDSSYLLDDEPQRSHWRAWVAIGVLALLGFLIYKQWRAVKAGAMEVAQRATASASSTAPTKPQDSTSSEETAPAPVPSDNSSSQSAKSNLDKPESDKTDQSPAFSKTETDATAGDANSAAAAKEKDQSDEPAKNKDQSDEAEKKDDALTAKRSSDAENSDSANDASMDDAADSQAAEQSTTKSTKKSEAAPAGEAKFDNAAVDQAERYLRGQGASRNCSRAISLLRSSARQGNPRAQVKLGALYATGHCVTQDRAAAYQWLARAQESQPDNSYLQRTMNSLWADMTPEERDRITR
jgi:hypothetical protein